MNFLNNTCGGIQTSHLFLLGPVIIVSLLQTLTFRLVWPNCVSIRHTNLCLLTVLASQPSSLFQWQIDPAQEQPLPWVPSTCQSSCRSGELKRTLPDRLAALAQGCLESRNEKPEMHTKWGRASGSFFFFFFF